jgi:hypothetical protein
LNLLRGIVIFPLSQLPVAVKMAGKPEENSFGLPKSHAETPDNPFNALIAASGNDAVRELLEPRGSVLKCRAERNPKPL